MVLQKILRDLILFAQPFLCSFRKWVLFFTFSAITLYSLERKQSFASVPTSLAFHWSLRGILGMFDFIWHSTCSIRLQSSQNETIYCERRNAKYHFMKNTVNYVASLLLFFHVLYDSLEKTELQKSLQSVTERANVTKSRRGRMQLLQQVTRFRG